MLAAGIKTPVPMEELEIHLRDEIERQMSLGLSEQEAFEISVQQIGQPKTLDGEFKKNMNWRQKFAGMKTVWLAMGLSMTMETICRATFSWMNQHERYHSFFTDFGDPTTILSRFLYWFQIPGLILSEFIHGSPWAPPYPQIDWPLVFGVATLQWFLIFFPLIVLFRRRKIPINRYA